MTAHRLRIALADDAALFRELLAGVLHEVAGAEVTTYADAEALLEDVDADPPDLAVVDIRLPPSFTVEGIEAARTLRRRHPRVGVLLLSQHLEGHHLEQLMTPGAAGFGYLLKERVAGVADFVETVKRIAAGESVIDPLVVRELLGRRRVIAATQRLSPREREVLALIAEGHSNQAICGRLGLSGKTVETHIAAVFTRLDLPAEASTNRRVLAVLTFLRTL